MARVAAGDVGVPQAVQAEERGNGGDESRECVPTGGRGTPAGPREQHGAAHGGGNGPPGHGEPQPAVHAKGLHVRHAAAALAGQPEPGEKYLARDCFPP
eukprot:4271691-Pyramimonas_sp.AAC.2